MNTTKVFVKQGASSLLEAKKLFLKFLAEKTEEIDDAITTLTQLVLETKKLFFYDGSTGKIIPIDSSFHFSHEELSLIHHFMNILFIKGREQKYFRQDISAELAGRLFIKRLIDSQTIEVYSHNRTLSYNTIYTLFINDFVKVIFSQKGMRYFKKLEAQTQPF